MSRANVKADQWRKSWNHNAGFYSERGRKSVKPHVCDVCECMISVGARYLSTTVCENGKFETLKTCKACVERGETP